MLENARKTNRHHTCSRGVVDRHGSTLLSHVTKRKKCVHLLGTGSWDSTSGEFSKQ